MSSRLTMTCWQAFPAAHPRPGPLAAAALVTRSAAVAMRGAS